jgi:hypothetical protein
MGVIVNEIDPYNHPSAWSELWKIFAPPGHTKTYSQMSDAELLNHRRKDKKNNAYQQFTEWLRENETTI